MKFAALAFFVLATPAAAADVSLTFNDGQRQSVSAMPNLLERCMTGMVLNGEYAPCRTLSVQLQALSNDVAREHQAVLAREAAAKKAEEEKAKPGASP